MANVVFSLEGLNYGEVPDKLSSTENSFVSVERGIIGKQFNSYGVEDSGESGAIDSFYSDYGFYQGVSSEQGFLFSKYQQREQSVSSYELPDNLRFDIPSPPIQTCLEEIPKHGEIPSGVQEVVEPKKEKQFPFSLASLELLKNYGSGFKRLKGERRIEPNNDMAFTKVESRKLSTEEIMKIAGERFIRSSSRAVEDVVSMLSNPFDLSFSGLSAEEMRDVELAEFLLASAEKVGDQQYERATRLLNQCDLLSSHKGNPVQRIVYYFAEALREKINRETGRIASKEMGKKQPFDIDVAMMSVNPTFLACHEEIPFSKIIQFAGIQAIVENVAEAKKIHIIDLGIRNGVQWTVLMQALASRYDCPLELLKITAVGTMAQHLLEDTGRRLTNFANSMNLPFSYNIVMVSDMLQLKEHLFSIDVEETIAVYAQLLLRSMLAFPDRLENIMRVIRNINPSVMVVTEIEANHNSPVFVNRFIEVLFYFSAYFDCLDACMKPTDPHRMITESMYFRQGIRNMVAAEGEERKTRHVKLDVWKAFFARYGMDETELSMSSLYQASLLAKKFACGSSCTMDLNGKSLIVGWKGTPVHSVSVWKFI
ncbi:DELLA protein [Melia azedarach]|uniref:DELLA protein n=1 Tax=Melia azedarach TaxID=155640 RepID=A0ACC1YGA2_MELAZ|nr:DELLA protein [Melia azedarach]